MRSPEAMERNSVLNCCPTATTGLIIMLMYWLKRMIEPSEISSRTTSPPPYQITTAVAMLARLVLKVSNMTSWSMARNSCFRFSWLRRRYSSAFLPSRPESCTTSMPIRSSCMYWFSPETESRTRRKISRIAMRKT